MKKVLLASAAAIAALAAAGSASAADLAARPYTKAPAYTAPQLVYNWTGFYIGGHIGGAFGGDNSLGGNNGQFMAGVQGGADYQFGQNWVVGIEAQYSWLPSNNTGSALLPGGFVVSQQNRGLGSVTGRLGYTWGPTLLYAKGGYAWRDSSLGASFAGAPIAVSTSNNSKDGYTVGGGLEYMFAPNWSGKIEYQYYHFDNTTFTGPVPIAGTSFRNEEHTIKAGINYRFGWGGNTAAAY